MDQTTIVECIKATVIEHRLTVGRLMFGPFPTFADAHAFLERQRKDDGFDQVIIHNLTDPTQKESKA